jgi:very-short-patch-repair endonuclease
VSVEADRLIAEIATAQHGAVARRQLLEAGVPAHVIAYRVRSGALVPLFAGAYAVAGSALGWHQRIMAGTLASGPGAVASHRAAAFLHGLAGIEPRVEVSVARDHSPRAPGLIVHRLQCLLPSDVELREGIARTRPPATLLALAAVVPATTLERALDDALARGLVSCAQIERRLDSVGRQGRAGAGALGRLLAGRSSAPRWTQSEFERRLLRLLRDAGIPVPVPQFEVRLPNGRRAFLDLAWPDIRLALEANSYRHHAGRLAWSKDNTRNNAVIALGWRIIPVTWEDLVSSPADLIALLRRARAA